LAALTTRTDSKSASSSSATIVSHSAQVTEISLDHRGRVHVERIVFALDCGITINPDLIRAQVEGGLLFGLSAADLGRSRPG
jgi:isoquinoline 1-oxidoreductase beta subunit